MQSLTLIKSSSIVRPGQPHSIFDQLSLRPFCSLLSQFTSGPCNNWILAAKTHFHITSIHIHIGLFIYLLYRWRLLPANMQTHVHPNLFWFGQHTISSKHRKSIQDRLEQKYAEHDLFRETNHALLSAALNPLLHYRKFYSKGLFEKLTVHCSWLDFLTNIFAIDLYEIERIASKATVPPYLVLIYKLPLSYIIHKSVQHACLTPGDI